ncbi:MAG: DinB family protein [Saprospiraceae bacterium]
MQQQLDILKATRANILKQMEGVSLAQLNEIPDGFNNNLIWNAGHVAVTQQLLCYAMSGLEVKLPKEVIAVYRKGAKPESAITQAEVDQIKVWLTTSIDWLATDLKAGIFETYKEYATSYGFTLTSIADAVSFNNVHEGMHLGYMIALKKKLGL